MYFLQRPITNTVYINQVNPSWSWRQFEEILAFPVRELWWGIRVQQLQLQLVVQVILTRLFIFVDTISRDSVITIRIIPHHEYNTFLRKRITTEHVHDAQGKHSFLVKLQQQKLFTRYTSYQYFWSTFVHVAPFCIFFHWFYFCSCTDRGTCIYRIWSVYICMHVHVYNSKVSIYIHINIFHPTTSIDYSTSTILKRIHIERYSLHGQTVS